jgi:hypothetical protein
MSRIAIGRLGAAGVDAAEAVVQVNPMTGRPLRPYDSPDGRSITVNSTMGVLFSDDFGGSAIDAASRWDAYDGGLGAVTLGDGTAQGPIGSGVTMAANGGTVSVGSSNLVIGMPAVANVEYWLLSKAIFAGSEDLLFTLTKSVSSANNSLFVGLVEVDPVSGYPLANPNLAADFTNRGGAELGKSAVNTAYNVECVADSSGVVASSATASPGAAAQSFALGNEVFIEFEAVDVIASTVVPDSITGRAAAPARVSSQCPNDGRAYKLLIRARNIGATAVTFSIGRVLVKDGQEFRAEVSSGRGDLIAQKALAVNPIGAIAANATLQAGAAVIGALAAPAAADNTNTPTVAKVLSAASTNATSLTSVVSRLMGGVLANTSAAFKFFRLYNKASAPTVGTDAPLFNIAIPPGASVNLGDVVPPAIGKRFSTGLAYAITGAAPDLDNTAVAANDVVGVLFYL